MQFADEHKTINAFELQELLETCLPNDYVKSCANLEVCRQIVIALEVSEPIKGDLNCFVAFIQHQRPMEAVVFVTAITRT